MAHSDSTPKTIGRYHVEARVGGGGMAEVYRARVPEEFADAIGREHVAIKMLLPAYASDPQFREMFEEEAEISGEISHPNVVELVDFGQMSDGSMFLVMEWVDGCDFAAVLRSFRKRRLRLNPVIACAIVEQALRGLHAAHTRTDRDGTVRSVIHRDVSPANVLLSVAGDVKIADFGLARPLNRVRKTLPGIVKGKFAYLAPEQTFDRMVDPRTDVFAAGIVLWEALASRHLFRRNDDLKTVLLIREAKVPDIRRYAPGIDERIVAALERALQGDPERRFPTALAFAEELAAFLATQPIKVGPKMIAAVVKDVRTAEQRPVEATRPSRLSLPRVGKGPPPLPRQSARVSQPAVSEPMPLMRRRFPALAVTRSGELRAK